MSLKVLRPGLQTTIQDLGRFGHQNQGFSSAGAVDYLSHTLANQLLGNDPSCASIEMTLQGASFEVESTVTVATAGAPMELYLNKQPIPIGEVLLLVPGDELYFGVAKRGLRTYLALLGGVDVEPVLGSRSTHIRSGIGGYDGRPLEMGDTIDPLSESRSIPHYMVESSDYGEDIFVDIIPGQQYDDFTNTAKSTLLNTEYTVTKESDRMGIRLEGEVLNNKKGYDVISEPTQLGSVQVPSSGKPIILLNDRQTAGGYSRIATVALKDIPKLAQARPGDRIHFSLTDVDKAWNDYLDLKDKIDCYYFLSPSPNFEWFRRPMASKISDLL